MSSSNEQRIDKFISNQMNISRKEAHKLIHRKSVLVNGKTVQKTDVKIEVDEDNVEVMGKTIKYREYIYIMMNKPAGILSASNGKGQKTVIDLLPSSLKRKGLFPAGRLDKDTTGFVLITDDGNFAHRMLSPKNNVPKTYEAHLNIKITDEHIKLFSEGIIWADGTKLKPAQLSVIDETKDGHIVQIIISEGKFHQIKRMIESINGKVIMLKRTKIGSLSLCESLQLGQSKEIVHKEMTKILL